MFRLHLSRVNTVHYARVGKKHKIDDTMILYTNDEQRDGKVYDSPDSSASAAAALSSPSVIFTCRTAGRFASPLFDGWFR